MANPHKQRILDAINKFSQTQLDKNKPKESRAHYEKPEKEVEKSCLEWMRSGGWSVQIFEAKATFDPKRGVWRQQAMRAGVCDCMGNDKDGQSVVIEFKAKGKLSSFNRPGNYKQRQFITDKINTNSFACVVDSKERLEQIYTKWRELRAQGLDAKAYLISMLPITNPKTANEDALFGDD